MKCFPAVIQLLRVQVLALEDLIYSQFERHQVFVISCLHLLSLSVVFSRLCTTVWSFPGGITVPGTASSHGLCYRIKITNASLAIVVLGLKGYSIRVLVTKVKIYPSYKFTLFNP